MTSPSQRPRRVTPAGILVVLGAVVSCARQAPPQVAAPDAGPALETTNDQSDALVANDVEDVEVVDVVTATDAVDGADAANDSADGTDADVGEDICPGSWFYLPPGPKSSKKPCLCYPTGDNCDFIAYNGAHGVPPDPAMACPKGELCTGGVEVIFDFADNKPNPKLGTCERPCVNPEATVAGSGGCDSGERCVVYQIGGWSCEPHAIAKMGVCNKGVPYWCPQWASGSGGSSDGKK